MCHEAIDEGQVNTALSLHWCLSAIIVVSQMMNSDILIIINEAATVDEMSRYVSVLTCIVSQLIHTEITGPIWVYQCDTQQTMSSEDKTMALVVNSNMSNSARYMIDFIRGPNFVVFKKLFRNLSIFINFKIW